MALINFLNWRGFSNTIHSAWVSRMGMKPGTNEETLFLATEFGGEAGELFSLSNYIAYTELERLTGELITLKITTQADQLLTYVLSKTEGG